jgi:Coenzyme PQQ synthesis protein D (PqqD)
MTPELSITSRVRINETVLFQELQGEAVLLNLKTGVYLGLDKVGARIWQLLGEHDVLSEVAETMLREYDLTEERCREDLLHLVKKMEEQALVTVS